VENDVITALLLAALSPFTVTNSTYDGPVKRPSDARLVWHDEFSGSALDLAQWRYDTSRNKQGWFNHEKQYYSGGRAENLRLRNGHLVIEARHEKVEQLPDWGGQNYTSAKIVSKRAWTYGFYEIRAKLPCAAGTWPAIWMLRQNLVKWPEGGEIDIMEQVGAEPNLIYSTLHTKAYNHTIGTQRSAQRPVASSCSAFHRYQLDWRPDVITIGVDGRGILRHRRQPTDGTAEWPFDAAFDLIINLAIGGDWASQKGIDDAALPQRMEVDYVRVWQSLPHSQRR
jgi:beta-glucanase (GH16 family)